MEFNINFISNKEEQISVSQNPSELYEISPVPQMALDFSGLQVIDKYTMTAPVIVEYGIIGKFKIPPSFNLTEEQLNNQPGMIFTQIITVSEFEIKSPSGYFKNEFPYSMEIEEALIAASTLAVKYNKKVVQEKLQLTRMENYTVIEMTEGFIKTAVRQLFFLE